MLLLPCHGQVSVQKWSKRDPNLSELAEQMQLNKLEIISGILRDFIPLSMKEDAIPRQNYWGGLIEV